MSKEIITVGKAKEWIKDSDIEYDMNNKPCVSDIIFDTEDEAIAYLLKIDDRYKILSELDDNVEVYEIYSDDEFEEFLGYKIA
jgi:hypothetical protein